MSIRILEIASHRNGVGGEPFYAVRFTDPDEVGEFLAVVFDTRGHFAVINTTLLPEHGVAFGRNSWRGDHYVHDLRRAIVDFEEREAGEANV